MFEITTLAARDTFTLELVNTNDEPLVDADGKPLSVTLYGPGSKAYARAMSERNQRLIDRSSRKGKIKLSLEEQTREGAQFLADCTVSLNGWAYQGATDHAAILAAYCDRSIGFIADQVSRAVGDWANFTSSSSTS